MSNAKQILSMLRSRAEGDEDQFLAIALQVAAAEARQGRRTNAEQLRAAVEQLRRSSDKPSVRVSLARPRGDLEGLLDLRTPAFRLGSPVVSLKPPSRTFLESMGSAQWWHLNQTCGWPSPFTKRPFGNQVPYSLAPVRHASSGVWVSR